MAGERWFYRSVAEWREIYQRLKQTPCPHCKVVGMLIRHGTALRGYDCMHGKTERGQRVFCSDRHARRGCGRTFSVWVADKIKRFSVTTRCLWSFLNRAVTDGVAAAIRAIRGEREASDAHGTRKASNTRDAGCPLSDRTWQRNWKRFRQAQSNIRTVLCNRCSPPELPAESSTRPAAHVIAHLKFAFPNTDCPIAAFQHAMRTFFL